MPRVVNLQNAMRDIRNAIYDKLEDARQNGDLKDIRHIIRSSDTFVGKNPPTLSIVFESARPDYTANYEMWNIPFTLAVVVSSRNPEEGEERAIELVSRAADTLMLDRRLGLNFVQDIKIQSFDTIKSYENNNLHGSWILLEVSAVIRRR